MNTNKFKVLLCCYTIGIAGCSKVENSSSMQRNRQTQENKSDAASVSDVNAVFNPGVSGDESMSNMTINVGHFIDQSNDHALQSAEQALERHKKTVQRCTKLRNEAEERLKNVSSRIESKRNEGLGSASDNNERSVSDFINQSNERALKSAEQALERAKNAETSAKNREKEANDRLNRVRSRIDRK